MPTIIHNYQVCTRTLTGRKERMKPYLANMATAGFVALSFDAFQHGERATERPEQFISRIAGNISVIIGRSWVK